MADLEYGSLQQIKEAEAKCDEASSKYDEVRKGFLSGEVDANTHLEAFDAWQQACAELEACSK